MEVRNGSFCPNAVVTLGEVVRAGAQAMIFTP